MLENINEEQRKALKLNRENGKAWYNHETTTIDEATGEIISSYKDIIYRTSGEPDYVKFYYSTVLAFNGAIDIPVSFIMAVSKHIAWTNTGEPMHFSNSKFVRADICKSCGIKEAMYKRYLSRCKEHGFLLPVQGFRGLYEVNPFFIAKGRWDNIKELRASFDYTNGVWQRKIVENEENIEQ